jgi:hypothetical protein
MAANRWKLITLTAGGLVAALMLLAAAFSLGVYVGEHGWTRDGLSYAGPGGNLPAGNRPAQGGQAPDGPVPPAPQQQQQPLAPAGLPPGRPNFNGRIIRISPQKIELAAPNGLRIVVIGDQTRFLDQDGTPIALRDLQPGDVIAVYGLPAGDGGELLAEFIVRLPPKEPTPGGV